MPTEDVQGEGSWVEVVPLTYGEGLGPEPESEQDFLALLARHVVGWNWVDYDARPLPQPKGPASLKALTDAELGCLTRAVRGRSAEERNELRLALRSSLWTGGGQLPREYTELQLCRDVYHCRRAELYRESLDDVLTDLSLLSAEAEVQGLRSGLGGARRGRVKLVKGEGNAGAKK